MVNDLSMRQLVYQVQVALRGGEKVPIMLVRYGWQGKGAFMVVGVGLNKAKLTCDCKGSESGSRMLHCIDDFVLRSLVHRQGGYFQ